MSVYERAPWLSRPSDDTHYVGVSTVADKIWDTLFENLSKNYGSGMEITGDVDAAQTYIRDKLEYLLPEWKYQYSRDQVLVWMSLMMTPLTVSNEHLQKVIAMDKLQSSSVSEDMASSESRGFLVYEWTLSMYDLHTLYVFLGKEERTVHEMRLWDSFVDPDNNFLEDDKIFVRYIGSCVISKCSTEPMANLFNETENPRAGFLADFLKALVTVLPTVAATCQCHVLRHITTSAETPKWRHELIHSALIEFFGSPFVINRHPSPTQWLTERHDMLGSLNISFTKSALEGALRCPPIIAAKLQQHFDSIKCYVACTPATAKLRKGVFHLDNARCAALLGQSMPRYHKHERAIMVVAARDMHINDYMRGRPFSFSYDPDHQLLGQLLKQFNHHLDLRTMAMPFAYYCLSPWPKVPEEDSGYGDNIHQEINIVTLGRTMGELVLEKSGNTGGYGSEVFLGEAGKPIQRLVGNRHIIHVPLLNPSRCRYGVDEVDEAARKFMQTSFWNAMLIADKVMQTLDNTFPISYVRGELEEEEREDSIDQSEAICSAAMQLYRECLTTTDAGKAFAAEFDKDSRVIQEMAEEYPMLLL
ncbi:hypothetical protein F4678DRAFT_460779 [Xylaria arbuscula]|nr:hypothetical protein F4678DRAFT_460779 [Xylaria arbuscula]